MLSPLLKSHKLTFLSIFGAAILINLLRWSYDRYTLGGFTHIPYIFWEGIALLSFIAWNPKGIRLVLLALLGFFIFELVFYNFFVGGMSSLPYWYLFRDVYTLLHLDSLYDFLIESVLLLSMTVSLFLRKAKPHNELLDSPEI